MDRGMDDIGDDHVDSMDMASCVQQPRLSTEQEGSSQHCPLVDNGQVVSTERASSGDINHVDARNETSDGTEPSAIIIDAVDQSINSEGVPNLQVESTTSGGADQTASPDARQEYSDGMELEMTVFRSSDVADQNDTVDHESVIDGSLMPELTRRDSPPSYESVLRERSTFNTIQPPDCEEVSTTTDNNTVVDVNVITTQPQSNITNSPSVAADRDSAANYNQDDIDVISDSDSELAARVDYLRRHRRERGGIDNECCDNLGLFCTVCYMCAPSGHTSQDIEMHGNCTRDCCELLYRCTCDWNNDGQPDCNCGNGDCGGCNCGDGDCGGCDGGGCDGGDCDCDGGDCDCDGDDCTIM